MPTIFSPFALSLFFDDITFANNFNGFQMFSIEIQANIVAGKKLLDFHDSCLVFEFSTKTHSLSLSIWVEQISCAHFAD